MKRFFSDVITVRKSHPSIKEIRNAVMEMSTPAYNIRKTTIHEENCYSRWREVRLGVWDRRIGISGRLLLWKRYVWRPHWPPRRKEWGIGGLWRFAIQMTTSKRRKHERSVEVCWLVLCSRKTVSDQKAMCTVVNNLLLELMLTKLLATSSHPCTEKSGRQIV